MTNRLIGNDTLVMYQTRVRTGALGPSIERAVRRIHTAKFVYRRANSKIVNSSLGDDDDDDDDDVEAERAFSLLNRTEYRTLCLVSLLHRE